MALLVRGLVLTLGVVGAAWAGSAPPTLTAEQVVERNVAARGGLEAWRNVKTMAWAGHIEASNVPGGSLPFVLEMGRPNKTRFSVDPQGQPSARIFDGHSGWRLRMSRDGSPGVKPYSDDELKAARDGQGIDGPLIDAQARHIPVALAGMDAVDGKPAYVLAVTLPSGTRQQIWVDAESFLDVRADRETKDRSGRANTVWISYRDYQTTGGLKIPRLIETSAVGGSATDRMVIERVVLNPGLDAQAFAEPAVPIKRRKVIVDARTPPKGMGGVSAVDPAAGSAQGGKR